MWLGIRLRLLSLAAAAILALPPGPAAAAGCLTLEAYQRLQSQILAEDGPIDLDLADCLLTGETAKTRFRELAAKPRCTAPAPECHGPETGTCRPEQRAKQCGNRAAMQRLFLAAASHEEVLLEHLKGELDGVVSSAAKSRRGPASTLAWSGAYLSLAAVVALERGAGPALAQLLVDYYRRIEPLRDCISAGKAAGQAPCAMGWSGAVGRSPRLHHATMNARILYPFVRLANLVRSSPALAQLEPFALEIVAVTRTTLDGFESDWSFAAEIGASYYHRRPDNRIEAINHANSIGLALLELYKFRAEVSEAERIKSLLAVFSGSVEIAPNGAASWAYFPRGVDLRRFESSELIWKGAISIQLPAEAMRAGLLVDPSLSRRLSLMVSSNLFHNFTLNRRIGPKMMALRRKGTRMPGGGAINNLPQFLVLAGIDRGGEPCIINILAERPDIFAQGWLTAPGSVLGLAHFIGRGEEASQALEGYPEGKCRS